MQSVAAIRPEAGETVQWWRVCSLNGQSQWRGRGVLGEHQLVGLSTTLELEIRVEDLKSFSGCKKQEWMC